MEDCDDVDDDDHGCKRIKWVDFYFYYALFSFLCAVAVKRHANILSRDKQFCLSYMLYKHDKVNEKKKKHSSIQHAGINESTRKIVRHQRKTI